MNDMARRYDDFLARARKDDGYWRAFTLLQFIISVRRIMQRERVTGRALADRIHMAPPTLSRHLKGTENTGVDTMVKIAGGLDAVVHIHVAKSGVPVKFLEGWQDTGTRVEVRSSTSAFGSAPPAERTYLLDARV